MKRTDCRPTALVCAVVCHICLGGRLVHGAEPEPPVQEQLRQLRLQNEQLQRQMQQQQELIESLSRKVSGLESGSQRPTPNVGSSEDPAASMPSAKPFGLGKINLSGEGGLAFFHSQSEGPYPKAEFRIDEARLFLEAQVWQDVYFVTEADIALREEDNLNWRAGELYLDFEDLSRFWNRDRQLNVRLGRFYIPFGEEYLQRNAINNPLISHSLSDLWGLDQGLELYGAFGKLHYVLAVQNGGVQTLTDFNSDKSVAARVSYDPANWLHTSVSAMRTGDLDTKGDMLSAIWFGNGFFRSLSPNATTFRENLVEGDVRFQWSSGHLQTAGGYVHADDNDKLPTHRQRDVYYYYVEAVQNLTEKFYAATRWSQILAHRGFPVVGNGDFGKYLFDDTELTTGIWRLGLGVGYRLSQNLLLKAEYTFEEGDTLSGKRKHENLFAAEVAFKF